MAYLLTSVFIYILIMCVQSTAQEILIRSVFKGYQNVLGFKVVEVQTC